MTPPDMNTVIHNAVRRDLRRMEDALRSFPDGDADRARQLRRAWAELGTTFITTTRARTITSGRGRGRRGRWTPP